MPRGGEQMAANLSQKRREVVKYRTATCDVIQGPKLHASSAVPLKCTYKTNSKIKLWKNLKIAGRHQSPIAESRAADLAANPWEGPAYFISDTKLPLCNSN